MKNIIFRTAAFGLFLSVGLMATVAQHSEPAPDRHASDAPTKIALSSTEVVVPMQLVGRKPVVEVKINGQGPFRFFLDTGAGATVMDQSLVDELKLPVRGTTKIGDPADPEGITAKQNQIDKLEVGGATFSNFIAVSWDRAGIYPPGAPRGVLGMPLFRQLLLTVDYPANRVVIAKGSLSKADGPDIIDYQLGEAGLFSVPLKVAGQDVWATLDTGSPSYLGFPTEYQTKLPLVDKPVEVARGRTVGGEAIIYGAKLKGSIVLGRNTFDDPQVTFFDRLRHPNLGYGFIHDFAITIDQVNKRMRWARSAAPVVAAAPSIPAPNPATAGGELAQYEGLFGERRLSVADGKLYLRRIAGPQGEGPKLPLVQIRPDEFALAGTTEVRFVFNRDTARQITALKVLNHEGVWETAVRAAR
jgi:predicted aspartyl protease